MLSRRCRGETCILDWWIEKLRPTGSSPEELGTVQAPRSEITGSGKTGRQEKPVKSQRTGSREAQLSGTTKVSLSLLFL